jgi:hypothetical protein
VPRRAKYYMSEHTIDSRTPYSVSPQDAETTELARILAEQRECADYLLQNKGSDTDGAERGLGDWQAEEVWLMTENRER